MTDIISTTDHHDSAGEVFAAFTEPHRGLPRQSPGSGTTTRLSGGSR